MRGWGGGWGHTLVSFECMSKVFRQIAPTKKNIFTDFLASNDAKAKNYWTLSKEKPEIIEH